MSQEHQERYVLVFNAGSSSLKCELFSADAGLRSRRRLAVSDLGGAVSVLSVGSRPPEPLAAVPDVGAAARLILDRLEAGVDGVRLGEHNLVATGHRVVHGGEDFSSAVRVTASIFEKLRSLSKLAPLHNPPALAGMQAIANRMEGVPIVAVFDTAFFHDLPESARTYAIPADWTRRFAIRRYGFHGLAHQYMAETLRSLVASSASFGRAVTLHLGQGCSVTALRDGRAVETSMGFTPLEGLVMGTRPGDLDPGVLLHLSRLGLAEQEIDDALNRRSGLLGVSETSNDMRTLLELERDGHPGAKLALAVFCHRIHKYLGAYVAVLGGLGSLAFGGGIGEHSAVLRDRICAGLDWLGIDLDPAANEAARGENGGRISTTTSSIEVHVIPVDEQSIIAQATLGALKVSGSERLGA